MKFVIPTTSRQIKDAAKQLNTACNKDYATFKYVQDGVVDVDHYYGHEF